MIQPLFSFTQWVKTKLDKTLNFSGRKSVFCVFFDCLTQNADFIKRKSRYQLGIREFHAVATRGMKNGDIM